MQNDFGIGFSFEYDAIFLKLGAQVAEIFDDAVVDDGDVDRSRVDARYSRSAFRAWPNACGRFRYGRLTAPPAIASRDFLVCLQRGGA